VPEPLNPPIVASSSFRFRDTAELERALQRDGHLYSRWDNPTVEATERRIAELTGAPRALCFGSGMAAISSALLCALAERPRLLCQAQVYGGTHELVTKLLPRWGIEVELFEVDGWPAALADAAQRGPWGAVFAETPTNPTLRLVDLRAMAEATRALGALLIVDATFASPVNQRSLALGADVEVHSASKYLGGHHDLIAGAVACDEDFAQRLWSHRKLLGGILDPLPAYLLHRGLHTLEVRVERQNTTARQLAEWLSTQPRVVRVHHPDLPDHPDASARPQMQGGGGMLAFELRGQLADAIGLVDGLRVWRLASSLGGTESLVSMPCNTSHVNLAPAERARLGVPDTLIRLSVGLEPFELLRDDLARGLGD
jgi:cystathionine gamma-synthase